MYFLYSTHERIIFDTQDMLNLRALSILDLYALKLLLPYVGDERNKGNFSLETLRYVHYIIHNFPLNRFLPPHPF